MTAPAPPARSFVAPIMDPSCRCTEGEDDDTSRPTTKGPLPDATPDPASSDQPTVAWTLPEGSPAPPAGTPADSPAASGTGFAGSSGPPVGWGTPTAPADAPPDPAAPPATPPVQSPLISADPAPAVAWAAPAPAAREVAPGLVFASTGSRFVAYLIDLFILGVIDRMVVSALGAMA